MKRELNKFDALFNEMFFNILIHQPHSSVFDFVKRYFPGLIKPPGGWTIQPPGKIKIEEPHRTEHNLIFNKHPFFDIQFSEGKLELQALESKSYFPRITKPKLWFIFDNKADAEKALAILAKKFKTVSKTKKAIQGKGKRILLFSDAAVFESYNCIQFMLMKDAEKKYKILFSFGYDTESMPP